MGRLTQEGCPPKLLTPERLAKPSGVEKEIVILVADSFGTQGETATIEAGDSYNENGVLTSGPGSATTASVFTGFYNRMKVLRPGCVIKCYNHSVATISLETVLATHWQLARDRCVADGEEPTVVIALCGTNSSGTGQSGPVPGHVDAFVDRVKARFPKARIIWLGPFVDENNAAPGGVPAQARPEAGIVREATRARMNGVDEHFVDARDYTGSSDEVHLLNTSYTEVGEDMADLYYNGG